MLSHTYMFVCVGVCVCGCVRVWVCGCGCWGGGAAWGPSWFPCRPLKFSYAPMHTLILLLYHFVPLPVCATYLCTVVSLNRFQKYPSGRAQHNIQAQPMNQRAKQTKGNILICTRHRCQSAQVVSSTKWKQLGGRQVMLWNCAIGGVVSISLLLSASEEAIKAI